MDIKKKVIFVIFWTNQFQLITCVKIRGIYSFFAFNKFVIF